MSARFKIVSILPSCSRIKGNSDRPPAATMSYSNAALSAARNTNKSGRLIRPRPAASRRSKYSSNSRTLPLGAVPLGPYGIAKNSLVSLTASMRRFSLQTPWDHRIKKSLPRRRRGFNQNSSHGKGGGFAKTPSRCSTPTESHNSNGCL